MKPFDAIDREVTARVDVRELAAKSNACEGLRSQLQRAHEREDRLRKILALERENTIRLHGVVAAKDKQIAQYEAILTDLMGQLGEAR